MKSLKKTLQRLAQFYDERKTGEDGRFGFRRSSDLMTLYQSLDAMLENGIISYKKSIFLDLGCADGRVNIFFSYVTRLSIGIEIDEWSLEEYKTLLAEASSLLKREGLILPPNNIYLYHGDAFDPLIYKKIKSDTGIGIEDFDIFYTYLFMYKEFGDILREKGKEGTIFMIYGTGDIIPHLEGFLHINEASFPKNMAIYRKL
ncbi:MAG: hypothetical protein DRG39_01080 [Deltaproteobacteria bacterium]|nr:MAG: hypothetical protein DRG39_01080 [Deltaproteobacteria bacterium]